MALPKKTPAYLVPVCGDYVQRDEIAQGLYWYDLTWDDIPTIPDLDVRLLAAILPDVRRYNQGVFRERNTRCGTVMCRAGWAVHIAGLESYTRDGVGAYPYIAGALYAKAYPDRPIPYFGGFGQPTAIQDIVAKGLAGLVAAGA